MGDAARLCPSCDSEVPAGATSCPSCGAISIPPATDPVQMAELAARLTAVLGAHYAIERPLGRGGMAAVFLALDLRHHRRVAIKVLLPELAPALGSDRFLREIEIAAQLNHPHIVPLYDSGAADGLLYYVMPYVEGASLRHRIANQGALPIGEAIQIAREVADALAYAHELGVVHRDIKPENILLTHHHATVADFGVARALHATWGHGPSTTGGLALGTPHYMSPEQAESLPSVDHRTDIYALGCTLFEMLTGRPPYAGAGSVAIIAQHFAGPVPSARASRQEVPDALDALVAQAMAKRPEDRVATAAAFSAALEALAPPSRDSGASAATNPHRTAWWAAAALVALLGGAGLIRWATRGRTPSPDAPRSTLTVVVRPFEDRGADVASMATLLTERLTGRLMSITSLHVAASTAVAGLRDAPLDTLRARFAPDRFVVGWLDPQGRDSVRVTVQVVDPASGRGLFDSSFAVGRSRPGTDSASARLSLIVRHALWGEMEREQRHVRVRSAAAWALVERAGAIADDAQAAAQFRLDQRVFRSLDVADSLLGEAERLDHGSDLIPVERARVAERRAFVTEYFQQVLPAGPPPPVRAVEERRRALAQLDALIRTRGGPADAYELRGRIKLGLQRALQQDTLLEGAVRDFRSATELDAHRATAWKELGAAQRESGLYEDALLSVDRAFDEDDFQLYRAELLRSRFDAALRTGRYAIADTACHAWLGEAPRLQRIFDCELLLWSRTRGDVTGLRAARARADSLRSAGDSIGLTYLIRELYVAQVAARAGDGASADATATRVTARLRPEWRAVLVPELAYVRLLRGDADSAAALIAEAERSAPAIRRLVERAPWFAALRSRATATPGRARP